METYNYREAVKEDVLNYIKEHAEELNNSAEYYDRDELAEYLKDTLWTEDGVTGNASGSYTFNTWQAEENIAHNLDLLGEALTEFGCSLDYLIKNGAEACDVTIRCYLLGECISEALDEAEEEGIISYADEEEENEE